MGLLTMNSTRSDVCFLETHGVAVLPEGGACGREVLLIPGPEGWLVGPRGGKRMAPMSLKSRKNVTVHLRVLEV